MFKRLVFFATLVLLLSIGSVVGATELDENEENDDVQLQAGRMTPSVQTIYGGSAQATWTLNWSGTGPWQVSFSANGEPYRTINTRTNSTGMNHTETYSSSASYVKYNPRFRAVDSKGNLSAASGTVHKYLRR